MLEGLEEWALGRASGGNTELHLLTHQNYQSNLVFFLFYGHADVKKLTNYKEKHIVVLKQCKTF